MEEASAKRQKVDEPKPSAKWGVELATITGAQCKERASAMVITCDDDICQDAMDYGDKSLQRALSVIPGVYWLVGTINGWPVFRQEPAGTSNGEQLVMYHQQGEGWYICDKLVNKVHDDLHTAAWGKKPTMGVQCVDNEKQIQALSAEVALLSSKAGECAGECGGEGSSKGSSHHGSGKHSWGKVNKSGWLNKAVPIAIAVIGKRVGDGKGVCR